MASSILTDYESYVILQSVTIHMRELTRDQRQAILATNPGFIAHIAAKLGCSSAKVSRTFAGLHQRNDPRLVREIEARLPDALKELV